MRSSKTIAVGFSMIAATLAIQGVTPAQGTPVEETRMDLAKKKLKAAYEEYGRDSDWTHMQLPVCRDGLLREIECAMSDQCLEGLKAMMRVTYN